MKINILTRWLPPEIDGVGDYAWNLSCALRGLGAKVRLFSSAERSCVGSEGKDWVFPVIRRWEPAEIIKAIKSVSPEPPDWFCFQYVPQLYGRRGIAWQVPDILKLLKKEFCCNMAVTFHEFIWGWGIGAKDLFLAGITRLQTRRMLSAVDLAVTTCGRYKDSLERLSGRYLPVAVIPVGSSIEPCSITPEKLAGLRRQNFPDRAKVFGFFSRLSPFRNFPLSVRALERARQEGIDAWLYLIGSVERSNPKLFRELMRLAGELGVRPQIITSGELSKEGLSVSLRMVDVFLFPQTDGISTRNSVLMAALAHGLPVVSFKPQAGNFDGYHIPCSVLADRGDEEGFIRAAVGCLKDNAGLSGPALVNSEYYYRHFSWEIIAKNYLEALGGLR